MQSVRRSAFEQHERRGAAAVETAITLSVFLLVLFALLDLGLAALNSNNLKDVAQQVSRAAIVHGKNATPQYTTWGPATYLDTANSGSAIATIVAQSLIIAPAAQVNIMVEWPDGDTDSDDRVRTTLTYSYQMIMPNLFGYSSIPLKAVSTMPISD